MKNLALLWVALFALGIASCGKTEAVKMCKECGAVPGEEETNGFCEECFANAKKKAMSERRGGGGNMGTGPQMAANVKKLPAGSLDIGKEVPEIEGEDVDGVNFKLSDYRGKVVVLDFWGDW